MNKKQKKKKLKISFKPNEETMRRDPHDYSWARVVTNPKLYRKERSE